MKNNYEIDEKLSPCITCKQRTYIGDNNPCLTCKHRKIKEELK